MSTSTSLGKRESARIKGKSAMPAAKESKKQANKRDAWLLLNEHELETAFDFLCQLLQDKVADNLRAEGDRTFTNFAAICADELCPGIERIYNDDSTDDESDVQGECSEDNEDDTEEEEDEEETEEEDDDMPSLDDDEESESALDEDDEEDEDEDDE